MPELNEHESVERALSIMDEADKAAPAEDTAPEEAAPPASEGEQQAPEESAVEPQAPAAIEPPSTWKEELKAKWSALPQDLQQDLAQWETERNQGLNQKLEESAKVRQAAETERQAAAAERLKYVQQLDQTIQQSVAFDPILAQAAQTDWVKMWAEKPAEAGLLRAQVEQRVNQLQAWAQERQRVLDEHNRTLQTQAEQRLNDAIPEWKDEAKRAELRTSLVKYLTEKEGFKPEELQMVLDPRHVAVARKAWLWDQMEAAKQGVPAKRVVTPAKPARPAARPDGQQIESERQKALRNRAIRSDKTDDKVAFVMSKIGAT